MSIKDIKLEFMDSKNKVNTLISEWIKLEDDIYLGVKYKHNWRCKCGNITKRRWEAIIKSKNLMCQHCKPQKKTLKYKAIVEMVHGYEYVKYFKKGDIMTNGNIVKGRDYLQIKHIYCGNTYVVQRGQFINRGDRCTKCCGSYEKSFAHHIEVELGEPLEKYWDFEKNTVNPYHISKNMNSKNKKGESLKVWIKCQGEDVNELNGLMKKDYHGSYKISCNNFANRKRCSYCVGQKVHPYDSFGYHNFDKVQSWHPDNDISPFSVAKGANKKYKFICETCNHEWKTTLANVSKGRWCKRCNKSKGETRIAEWLDCNNINYFNDTPHFSDLLGINGGLLRPDFILPDHKIWIEYDGEFHYKDFYKDGSYEALQIHDKIKDEYAKKHGWKMIRIPYWDFDNIENILNKKLNGFYYLEIVDAWSKKSE